MKVGELVYNGVLGMGIVIADVGWSCRVVQWNRGNKTCISRKGIIEPLRSSWAAWEGTTVLMMAERKKKNSTEIFSLEGRD